VTWLLHMCDMAHSCALPVCVYVCVCLCVCARAFNCGNESCHTTNESCHAYESLMSRIRMSHVTYTVWVMSHIKKAGVEGCPLRHVWEVSKVCQHIMPRIWMSHVTHLN